MTRETKVGLAVAASFLCLVGIVVYSRLHKGETPSGPVAQAVTPAKDTVKDTAKSEPPKGKDEAKNKPETKPKGPDVLPLVHQNPGPPPLTVTPDDNGGVAPLPPLPSPVVEAPKPPSGALDLGTPNLPPLVGPGASLVDAGPKKDDKEDLIKKQLVQAKEKENQFGSPAPPPPGTPAAVDVSPLPPVGLDPAPPLPKPVAKPDAKDPLAGPAPAKKDDRPPVLDLGSQFPAPVAPPPPGAKENPFAVKPAPKDPDPLPPAVAPPAPPKVDIGKSSDPGPLPVAPAPPKPKPSVDAPPPPGPLPVATKPNPPMPTPSATASPLPPLGAPGSSVTPPIAFNPTAMSSGSPKVQSYDVKTYKVQSGETSFDQISQRVYGTPVLGKALLQFNREYPVADAGLRQEPPRVFPGLSIYYPPAEFLQTRFAQGGPTPSPAVTPIPVKAPIAMGTPAPLPANTPNFGTSTPIKAPAPGTTDATKRYQVRGQGEMILEIARNTLNDTRRWTEIYRLNPSIRPEYPIPGGTEIRLPGDANVP